MERKALVGLGVAVLGVGVAVWLWSRPRSAPPTSTPSASVTADGRAAQKPTPRPRPRRAPPARDGAPASTLLDSGDQAADTSGVSGAASAPTATDAATGRVAQLTLSVMREAVLHDWVITDERGSPCAPQNIRIVYDVPSDLKKYTKGAYFEPLGPAPTENSTEINGLLLCEGSSFQYLGFEGYWRAERGQWEVFPFPVVE